MYNVLTANEKKVLKQLLVNFDRESSINQIARACHLSPNGAYKLLGKLKREGILQEKKIANLRSFTINFQAVKTRKILELAFIEPLEGKIKYRFGDLKPLREITLICIIFGSYISKQDPHDLDLFIVLEKKHFRRYKQRLLEVKDLVPITVHDVIQTPDDLVTNLQGGNELIKKAIKEGIVLWGQEALVEAFTHV